MKYWIFQWGFWGLLSLQLHVPLHSYTETKIHRAVTYEFSGGRMGDNLIAYLHAKWISYKYDIPLLYRPFDYSSEFAFDEQELLYQPSYIDRYKSVVYLGRRNEVMRYPIKSTLYIVPYFPESVAERVHFRDGHGKYFPFFQVDWKNEGFRKVALEMLTPKKPIELCPCPKDVTTIAIHVRAGGGFDDEDLTFKQPLKCPPKSFYLEQLTKICEMLPDENLYFHIFTDDQNPAKIAADFEAHLGESRVQFVYRKEDNAHNQNVLEDLFSMMQFDCLIRAESSYSILASLLKDYKIVLHPGDFTFIDGIPVINRVEVVTN